jgi:hypothetical protein
MVIAEAAGLCREGEDSKKGSTHYKLNVKSPRIDALSSISMSRFASSDSFKPSVSPALPPPNTSLLSSGWYLGCLGSLPRRGISPRMARACVTGPSILVLSGPMRSKGRWLIRSMLASASSMPSRDEVCMYLPSRMAFSIRLRLSRREELREWLVNQIVQLLLLSDCALLRRRQVVLAFWATICFLTGDKLLLATVDIFLLAL